MRIEETHIPNVVPEMIDKSKISIAENIMKSVYPLFNEVYTERVSHLDELKKRLEKKKGTVLSEKDSLEKLVNEYRRKKKVIKLLERIEKMITSGLVYDGSLKHEMIILLKVITNLSEEKIDYQLKETLQIISKRFSK